MKILMQRVSGGIMLSAGYAEDDNFDYRMVSWIASDEFTQALLKEIEGHTVLGVSADSWIEEQKELFIDQTVEFTKMKKKHEKL